MLGGGHNKDPNAAVLRTTEVIDVKNSISKKGPPLPWKFYEHCAVKMVGQYVIVVGGFFQPSSTLFVDTRNVKNMFEGPVLPGVGRSQQACENIKHRNGSNYVIVTGGCPAGNCNNITGPLDTTDILIVNDYDISRSRWITGK